MDPLNQKSLETSKNHFLSVCWEFVFWVFGGFLNDDGLQLEVSLVGANWCGKPWSCHHFTRLVKHLIGGTKLAKDGPGRELKNHHGQNEFHHLDLGELIFLGSAILICGRVHFRLMRTNSECWQWGLKNSPSQGVICFPCKKEGIGRGCKRNQFAPEIKQTPCCTWWFTIFRICKKITWKTNQSKWPRICLMIFSLWNGSGQRPSMERSLILGMG